MARSRRTTDATTAAHGATGRLLSRPHPRLAPSSARDTAVVGSTIRMSAVFRATTARLFGQRVDLESDLGRRGAAASHTAMVAKATRNAPSRMAASLGSMLGLVAKRPWPAAADDSRGSP